MRIFYSYYDVVCFTLLFIACTDNDAAPVCYHRYMPRHKRHLGVLLVLASFFVPSSGLMAYSTLMLQNQITRDMSSINSNTARIAELQRIHRDRLEAEKKARERVEAEAKAAAEAAAKAASKQTGVTLPLSSRTCNKATNHADPSSIDVVVNKQHCLVPLNFTPSLVTVYGATISVDARENFIAMLDAASASGLPIGVTSSFRSYDNQIGTYNYWVGVNGSAAAADKISARPGYSEHQTGLAIDLSAGDCALECFARTTQKTWLNEHAYKYGFIVRYPEGKESITGYSPEAWHYRYVGPEVANDMRTRGILTLEEYWDISGGDY